MSDTQSLTEKVEHHLLSTEWISGRAGYCSLVGRPDGCPTLSLPVEDLGDLERAEALRILKEVYGTWAYIHKSRSLDMDVIRLEGNSDIRKLNERKAFALPERGAFARKSEAFSLTL
jgi:hypothetical protein